MHRDVDVAVLDARPGPREALAALLRAAECRVATFADDSSFLSRLIVEPPASLVLALPAPGHAELELQRRLSARSAYVPIVCVAAGADLRTVVAAMKGGAVDVLDECHADGDLLAAVAEARRRYRAWREQWMSQHWAHERYARLTATERVVFDLLVEGKRNKQIAVALASHESTVKVHRSHLMRKLETRSLFELLELGRVLEMPPARDERRL